MSLEKPLGIDVSRYQGTVDWDVVAAHEPKVHFVGIRATVCWGYVDSWFSRNWQEAKRVKLLRTAYHVVYPAENLERQINHFLATVGEDLGEFPLTLDIELDHGLSYKAIRDNIYKCAQLIETRTGKKPIMYSRAGWVNQFITGLDPTPPGWLNQYDWWLAQYLTTTDEHPGPATLPKGVVRERCIIHQTTDKGKGFGVESSRLDYDRWQGDLESLSTYSGVRMVPTLEERVEALEATVARLAAAANANGWNI
jgi:GH25 family lysozyme M1 (1,4-beta-N-acetylmuramidase)